MAFQRPTLRQLIAQALSIFATKLPGADVTLQGSNIGVTARVLAGLVNGCYGYLDYLAQQILPQTMAWFFLVRFGDLFSLTPDAGATASGNGLFTGIDGTNVPSGTEVQDSLQNLYRTTAAVLLGVGTTSIPVAAEQVGSAQNLLPGAPLTLTSAVAGVDAGAVADSAGFSGGLDPDSADNPDSFRALVVSTIQNPRGGAGTKADYIKWAKLTPGVTRVGINPLARGAGTVDVRFVMDGRANIIPGGGDIATVQTQIGANKPLTDDAQVQTVSANPVNYVLQAAAFLATDQDNVVAALKQMHANLEVGAGLSIQADIIPAVTGVAKPNSSFLTSPNADIAADPTKVITFNSAAFV